MAQEVKFVRGLGLLDSTMIVAGSMIGSGIFIVSADIARQVGAPGWLLVVWIITGLLTLTAALSYGELAAMMPKAGGQYVYLREAYSPLFGFLYGWTLFLVIQTGTIAAVAVGFARYLGVLWLIQNICTSAKTAALAALILLGFVIGWQQTAVSENFSDLWTPRGGLQDVGGGLTAVTAFGLFIAICVAQTNSLFSSDAWHNITFTAGEVKDPKRNIPLSLAFGTILVTALYLLANLAYLVTIPLTSIRAIGSHPHLQMSFSRDRVP